MELPVIFRAEKSGDDKDELTAVFPTLPGERGPYTFTVYAHIGQHGTGSKNWYWSTRAATESEYSNLLRELRGIYETGPDAARLVVKRRFTRFHDDARCEALGKD